MGINLSHFADSIQVLSDESLPVLLVLLFFFFFFFFSLSLIPD